MYLSQALPSGKCSKILVPNCQTPDSANASKCATCNSGYELNTTSGSCFFNCPDYCKTCTSSSSCTKCVEGYTLNANGNCVTCKIKGCQVCS